MNRGALQKKVEGHTFLLDSCVITASLAAVLCLRAVRQYCISASKRASAIHLLCGHMSSVDSYCSQSVQIVPLE